MTQKTFLQRFSDNMSDKLLAFSEHINARNTLIVSLILLICTSLLMIASASISFATTRGLEPLRFFWSQLAYVGIGVVLASLLYRIPLRYYYAKSHFSFVIFLWFVSLGLLILTALFGEKINGSQRWLSLGIFNLQAAELVKVAMVFVTADYVVRRSAEIRDNILTGVRLLIWYLPIGALLLFQPDFGTVAVLLGTLLMMVFVSGVSWKQYLFVAAVFGCLGGIGAWVADYRRDRMLSFWDPFDDIQGTDFQLARSLIAYGRGQFTGVGYGDSVQKLSHLPEAHTDFLLAITGEELGFVGVLFVLTLEALIIFSIMMISLKSLKRRQLRLSYAVFGFGVVVFGQVLINAGMTMGLAPTKGLTMPFFSFGGSSLVVFLLMIGFILKVDAESAIIDVNRQNDKY